MEYYQTTAYSSRILVDSTYTLRLQKQHGALLALGSVIGRQFERSPFYASDITLVPYHESVHIGEFVTSSLFRLKTLKQALALSRHRAPAIARGMPGTKILRKITEFQATISSFPCIPDLTLGICVSGPPQSGSESIMWSPLRSPTNINPEISRKRRYPRLLPSTGMPPSSKPVVHWLGKKKQTISGQHKHPER